MTLLPFAFNDKKTDNLQSCFIILFSFLLFSCSKSKTTLFEKLSSSETGIDFTNTLTETKDKNVLTYEYYYNGSGVATGDLNNDGFTDIYFTGNQVPSKLFLNKGAKEGSSFQFEDVTEISKIAGKNTWKTGVSMADVNADGHLDIYVCYSGFGEIMTAKISFTSTMEIMPKEFQPLLNKRKSMVWMPQGHIQAKPYFLIMMLMEI